jgi:trimeric autotransporter adhesin
MPNVLISELDLSPAVVGTDIFLIQHASGAPAEHCTAAQMAVYVAASGTTYFAGTALSLATTNTFNVTTVPIANGGSGQTTASDAFDALAPTTSSGDIIYRTAASGGNVRLAIGTPGQVLGISSGLPAWTTVAGVGTVTSVDVSGGGTGITYSGGPITAAGTITASGTLGVDYGGTSATTAIAAFNALAPTTTSGDLIYRTSTGNVRLAIGSSGQLLTASGGIPVWISPSSSGTVNYVDVSGGSTGLTFNGGPITASGTITATGTLDVAYGGTSATTAIAAFTALSPTTTSGDLIYRASATGANVRLGIGSSGQVLTASNGLPVWSANNGTVNYVDVSGGNTGLTFNGGPVTASGTITASGTLVVSAGGTGAATLTGVLKGTGTTAVVAATAGTDYVSPIVATNFTAQQTFAGATNILAAVFTNAAEVVTVATLAATGTVNYDITSQSVLYYTDVSTANFIPNFRGSSGNTLTSILATGQAVSAVWAVTMGTTAFYSTAVQVDGSTAGVTLKWQGGAAPTAGNASSVDAYNYTIIKTASESFTVLAAQTQFA